jgi:hypothetical protein
MEMTERRVRSATESLLTVAFGVEMVIMLFGAIAMAGAHKSQALEIIVSSILIMGALALGIATLRRGLNPIVYATQGVFLLPVVTEPMWALAWLVGAIFWSYCLFKGIQLDRRKEQK